MLGGPQVNAVPSCDILWPRSLPLLLGPCYGVPRWIQSHLATFFVLALYSSSFHVNGVLSEYRTILCQSLSSLSTPPWSMLRGRVPGKHRAILWHSLSSLSTHQWSMLRGSQVNTEPSCAILCPSSLLLPGPCYGGPRWIQSHLVTFLGPCSLLLPGLCNGGPRWIQSHLATFFGLALYYSSLVHVTGVPGEYRAILWHSCSSLSTPRWSMLWGTQVNTEPFCDILGPRSLLRSGLFYGCPRWIQSCCLTLFILDLFPPWSTGPRWKQNPFRTIHCVLVTSVIPWLPFYDVNLSSSLVCVTGAQIKTDLAHYHLTYLDHPFHILAVFLCPCSHPLCVRRGPRWRKIQNIFRTTEYALDTFVISLLPFFATVSTLLWSEILWS